MIAYSPRARARPSRTANVRFPARRSVSRSRTLLTTRIAAATSPTGTASTNASHVSFSTCAKYDPVTATTPKNRKTNTSPRPSYPYGRGPPVYSTPARIDAAPTSSSCQPAVTIRYTPASTASPNATYVATSTWRGGTSPPAVTRTGPSRSSVSAPRRASEESLERVVATWMNSAASLAAPNVAGRNVPLVAASAVPTSTGATAAGSVRGLAAISQMRSELGRSVAAVALTAGGGTSRSRACAWP